MSCSLLKNSESETDVLEVLRNSYYTIVTFSNVFQKPMQGLSCARPALHFSKRCIHVLWFRRFSGFSYEADYDAAFLLSIINNQFFEKISER